MFFYVQEKKKKKHSFKAAVHSGILRLQMVEKLVFLHLYNKRTKPTQKITNYIVGGWF